MVDPISGSVSKLFTTLATFGLAPLLKPWQMRREGKALAHNRMRMLFAEAQANQIAKQIEAGEKQYDPVSGEVLNAAGPAELQPIAEAIAIEAQKQYAIGIAKTALADGFRKAENLAEIIDHARGELEARESSSISPEQVNEDWFHKWRTGAEAVSQADMQKLWGRLLANEVVQPGSSGFGTLEILKRLSPDDAKLISKVLSFTLAEKALFGSLKALTGCGVTVNELLLAEELGILSSAGFIGSQTFEWAGKAGQAELALKLAGNLGIIVYSTTAPIYLKLPVVILTRAGRDLLSIGQFSDPPMSYIQAIADFVKKKGLTIRLAREELTRAIPLQEL
jgi:hypothetical protein